MGTRSTIARMNKDGSYDSIYCHWDGYPSNNGYLLRTFYNCPLRVKQLLALGDLSSLRPKLKPPKGKTHNFDQPIGDVCVAYGRDRGETGIETKHFASYDEFQKMLEDSWTEWVYVFRMDDEKWYYTNNPSPTWFKCCGSEQRQTEELTREACAAKKKAG